jgi:hypothetical protein
MDLLGDRGAPASSSHEEREWSAPLRRAVLLLGVVLALVGGGCGSGGTLEAKELLQQTESLQSLAAEGALLAHDSALGRTTRIFTQEHSSYLFRATSQVEATLKLAESEPALAQQLRRLTVLAGQVSADLERLAAASSDEERMLAGELEAAARACETIGEGLS